jgi:hypothetical protein
MYDTERRGKAWKDAARFKMILEVVLASTDFAQKNKTTVSDNTKYLSKP